MAGALAFVLFGAYATLEPDNLTSLRFQNEL